MLQLAMAAIKHSDLLRSLRARLSAYGRAAGLGSGAAIFALLAIIFLARTLAAYLATQVGPIWAPLITAGVLLVLGAILGLVAHITLSLSPKPAQTVIEN